MARAARVTPEGLTLKEEKFCQEYMVCANAEQAYRAAYAPGAKKNGGWVRTEACTILAKPHISARIEMLRAKTELVAIYDTDKAMEEAGEALELARALKMPAAMISAVTLRAKLAGVLVEKREVTNRSARQLSDEELNEQISEAAKQAGFVIKKAKEGST